MKAKINNQYYLEFGGHTIVSNGKTIWNYSPTGKKVIISTFEESQTGASLEKFFFGFKKSFKPGFLINESSSTGKSNLILELVPDNTNEAKDVSKVRVRLDRNDYTLHSVQIFGNSDSKTWELEDLIINFSYPKKTFEFKAPKGAEVIDLR